MRLKSAGSSLTTVLSLALVLSVSGAVGRPLRQDALSLSPVFGNRASIGGIQISGFADARDVEEVIVAGAGIEAKIPKENPPPSQPVRILRVNFRIDPIAEPGPHSVSVVMRDKTTRVVGDFTVNRLVLSRMTPARVAPGLSIRGVIYGAGLLEARAVEVEGKGIAVSIDKGGTQTALPVTVNVAADAPLGVRTVKVRAADGSISAFNALTVEKSATPAGYVSDFAGAPARPPDLGPSAQPGGPYGILDNTPALEAQIGNVSGLAADKDGSVYIADSNQHRILRVRSDGAIEVVAGTGSAGVFDGRAKSSMLQNPQRIALDGEGNLYIADTGNHRIRKITRDGVISTIAGGSEAGFAGDGAMAVNALLNAPQGVAVDRSGAIYIADTGNNRVRKITTGGGIVTIAGGGVPGNDTGGAAGADERTTEASIVRPISLAVAPSGDIIIVCCSSNLRKVTAQGDVTTVNLQWSTDPRRDLPKPADIAFDDEGNLFIAEAQSRGVHRVGADGKLTTVNSLFGTRLTEGIGRLPFDPTLAPMPDGSFSVQAAPEVVSSGNFANTIAMAVDTRGRIYLSDLKRVSEARYFPVIASLSMLSAVQGTSGMAVLEGSALHTARSVEFSGRGVSATMVGKPEGTRTPIRIDVSADAEPGPHSLTVTTDTGASPPFYSLEITRPGDPPRITDLQPFSGVQGATLKGVIRGHRLDNATAVAFSGTGVTVKLDGNGSTGILPVTITVAANAVPGARALTVTTPSGTSQPFRGFAVVAPIVAAVTPATAPRGMSTLLEIMGHGVEDVVSAEVSGQGITARILSSGSPAPPEVSNWQRGGENSGRGAAKVAPTPYPVIRVVITVASRAELGARTLSLSTRNGVSPAYGGLTVVPGEGTIRTLAASVPPILSGLETPRDIGADDAGNLYIASGSAIRKITPDGKAQTIFQLPTTPGGGRPDGSLNSIVVDRAGTLYAVTGDRLRIYKITSNGVTLLAGRAGPNETEENPERNRAILNANLGAPSGIAVDQSGNLFILDTRQRNVRRIALDGALTTVAGAGAVGTAARGDATEPKPVAITVDKGNLFIAEPGRIYRIAPDGTMQKVFDDQKDLEPQRLKITALAVDPKGNLFFASENRIFRLLPNGTLRVIAGQDQSSETNDGDGGPASAATIRTTKGLAIDGKGNIYFTTPNSVRMIVGGAEL